MIRRARLPIALLLSLVTVFVACTDRPAPTAPLLRSQSGASLEAGTCTTIGDLTALVNTVFGEGSPNAQSGLGKLSVMDKKLQKGDLVGAQEAARNLIRFILEKANSLPGQDQVPALIESVECYVGITNDTFLVYPTDTEQTLVADAGTAGIFLPPFPVTEPTLITLTILPDTTTGLLDTKLDQYPGFVEITQFSGVTNSLTDSVVVAVCPSAEVSPAVRNRLRLGHQRLLGFEVTQPGDASFLDCTASGPVASSSSKLSGWVRSLAQLVLPQPLYAYASAVMFEGGGVGGTVIEFSPFGPVDPELELSGGVGGTVIEFIRAPAPTPTEPTKPGNLGSKGSNTLTPVPSTPTRGQTAMLVTGRQASAAAIDPCTEGVVGTSLPVECRPRVTITTANGTILQGVPVSWAIGLGGGMTAIDDPTTRLCGSFGSTAETVTNANGKAGACWTLGAEAGENTLIATASAGGDAPEGVYFSPTSSTFTVTALKDDATISLSGLNQTYTGSPLEVTVTTSPLGLSTVNVRYDGSATPPTDAGSYAVVATLDNPSYEATTSGTFVIAPAAQSQLVVTGPGSATFGDAPVQLGTTGGSGGGAVTFSAGGSTACSVTADGMLTITSGTGTCSVTATKAADSNYEAVSSEPISVSAGKATATLSLSDLSFTYDGTGKSATASTLPEGLAGVVVTYDGTGTLPVNAGSYAVVATLSNADYSATPAAGTLEINKASQAALTVTGANTIAFGGSTVALGTSGGDGTGDVTFDAGASTACSVTAGGVVTATSGTGSCDITASKAGDDNYLDGVSSAPFVLTVSRAAATIALSDLSHTYDGSPKSATATTEPVGLSSVSITYDGSPTAPTGAGSYAVVATLTNPDYSADPASGTLEIAKADQPLFTLTAPAAATYGAGTVQASASGGAGDGSVSYASLTPAACSVNVASGAVTILTGVGTCDLSAAKDGDANYNPTVAAPASIALNKASQSISFGSLSSMTYGDAAFGVGATATSGEPVSFSAGAGSSCSVSGSTVTLTGAGSCEVVASQGGNDLYSAATPVSQSFSVAKRNATATAGSGAMTFGGTVPALPCTIGGLLAPDAGSVTCTTTVPAISTGGSYVTTPVVSPANPANYLVQSVNGTLNVRYVQQNCFAEPIKSLAVPPTTSGITKGATVQVRCTLLNANGQTVTVAKGGLLVEDFGTTGTTPSGTVMNASDVFRLSSGTYTYKLSTSGAGFTKGHFYFLTATWNDGSTTKGWFYLNK